MASSSSSSSSGPAPYAVGETILVEQGQRLHEAKVLQLGDGRDGQDVYMHYLGWNKKWDSWARLEHTRRVTPESRAEQARMDDELKQSHKKKQRSREVAGVGRASEKSVSASSAAARAIAAATESLKTSGESEVSSSLAPPLPSSLRRRLVLDWERLTRRQQIARLPARLPVLTLLAAFLHDHQANRAGEQAAAAAAAADADSAKQEAVLQVCEGLLCYFERCLPAVLLYRIERPQMTQLAQQHSLVLPAAGQVNDPPLFSLQHMTHTLPRPPATVLPSSYPSSSSSSSPPLSVSAPPTALTHWLPEPSAASASFASAVPQWSGVYGVEHLIRLLCKLPAILRDGEAQWMDEQRLAVRYTLTALYRWLSAHDELIYGYSAYEHPSSDYMYKLQQPHHAASYSDESVRHSDEQQQQQQQRGSGLKQLSRAQAQSPNKASNVKRDKR